MKEYSQEQVWKVYEKLPDELKEAIFSETTANDISDICSRNGLSEKQISEAALYTGRVLLGILHPDDLQRTFEEEMFLSEDTSRKIVQEINRFVFHPIKTALGEIYKTEIIGSSQAQKSEPRQEKMFSREEAPPEEKEEKPYEGTEKKSAVPSAGDTYREPVE